MKVLFHWTVTLENINIRIESAPAECRGRFRYETGERYGRHLKIYATNIEAFETIQEDEWSEWISLVDCARRERINKLRQKKDRIQSLGAGLLLRYSFLVEGYTVEQWNNSKIQLEQSGKPKLMQHPEFCYSLSHSGKWVICGVHSKELGTDIQEMRSWNMRMAKRFFATEEYERLLNAEEAEKSMLFYKMWTAKESYAKLTGEGIGKGISQYLTSEEFDKVRDTNLQEEADIRTYEMLQEYMICVCSRESNIFPDKIEIISYKDLK